MKFDSVKAILVTKGTDKNSNLTAKLKWIRHPRTDRLIYLFIYLFWLVMGQIRDSRKLLISDFLLTISDFGLRTSDFAFPNLSDFYKFYMWIFRAVGLKSCRLHILMNLPPPERSLLLQLAYILLCTTQCNVPYNFSSKERGENF